MKSTYCAALLLITSHCLAAESRPPRPCLDIANLSNSNQLDAAMARMAANAATPDPALKPRDEVLGSVDFDSDGKPEQLVRRDLRLLRVQDGTQLPFEGLLDSEFKGDLGDYFHLLGVVALKGQTYLVLGGPEGQLAAAARIEDGGARIHCRFALADRTNRIEALTELQAIRREAAANGRDLWEYAVSSPGVRRLGVLRRHRIPMDNPQRSIGLLVQAYAERNSQAFDWLLRNGADPNEGKAEYGRLLDVLVHQREFALAVAAVRAGAQLSAENTQAIGQLLRIDGAGVEDLVNAVVSKSRVVPEAFLIGALHRPALFDRLVTSGLPIRPDWWEWHAGVRIAMRPDAALEYRKVAGALEKATRAYRRTVPPATRHAAVTFGNDERGWRLQSAGGDRKVVPHEEFLLFSTAFCVYFLTEDCGPQALQNRARRWAAGLADTCTDAQLAATYDLATCNTVVYFRTATMPNSPQPMFVLPTGANARSRVPYSLAEMYRTKSRTAQP